MRVSPRDVLARFPWTVDDGTRAVPEPVAGDVTRVIVIGAGFAGLAAANALSAAGVDVLVLEARDRLGGRILTREVNGCPIDLGAAWIHAPKGNPLTELARRAGIRRRAFNLQGVIAGAAMIDERGNRLRRRERLKVLKGLFDFQNAAGKLLAARGQDTSLAELVEEYTAGDRDPWRGAWVRFALHAMVETELAAPLTDAPATLLDRPDIYHGGDDFPAGGYQTLITALTPDVLTRTSSEVRGLRVDAEGVVVELRNGRVEHGSHALVTVPLGVLKAGTIQFTPALPEDKTRAITALGFGDFEKVVLRYDERHWGGRASGFMIRSHETPFRAWIDVTRPVGAPTLIALAGGPAGQALGGLRESKIARDAYNLFAAIASPLLPEPRATAVTRWRDDPFSLGAYSYPTVGTGHAEFEALAAPVAGRVLFAGEATSAQRFGYADGAFTSGIREAKRLLGTSAVKLRLRG